MPEPQDLKSVLDAAQTPESVKADAWDAWHAATDGDDFQRRFDKLNLPTGVKAQLWDMKFGAAPAPTPTPEDTELWGQPMSTGDLDAAIDSANPLNRPRVAQPGALKPLLSFPKPKPTPQSLKTDEMWEQSRGAKYAMQPTVTASPTASVNDEAKAILAPSQLTPEANPAPQTTGEIAPVNRTPWQKLKQEVGLAKMPGTDQPLAEVGERGKEWWHENPALAWRAFTTPVTELDPRLSLSAGAERLVHKDPLYGLRLPDDPLFWGEVAALGGSRLAGGFSSPFAMALLGGGLASAPAAVRTAADAKFSYDMAKGAVQAAKDLPNSENPTDAAARLLELGVNTKFAYDTAKSFGHNALETVLPNKEVARVNAARQAQREAGLTEEEPMYWQERPVSGSLDSAQDVAGQIAQQEPQARQYAGFLRPKSKPAGETPAQAKPATLLHTSEHPDVVAQKPGNLLTVSEPAPGTPGTDAPAKGTSVVGVYGGRTDVKTPSASLPGRYALVEADSLVPSHNAESFAPNANYPAGVQERTYHNSPEAQSRVIQQSEKYDPAYTVNNNPDAVNGPPIITSDGIVYGGNSRVMATQRIYTRGQGDAYRRAVTEQAGRFGIPAAELDKFRNPVLVRVIDTPATLDDARRLGSELNKNMTGALGVSEKAVSAGKSVTPETLKVIQDMGDQLGEDATLRDVMREHGNDVLGMLTRDGVITERERPQFVDTATGGLSEEGKTFVERALTGKVVDDPGLMERAPKVVLSKVGSSLFDLISVGHRDDAYNILPLVREALGEHADIAARGSNVATHLSQPAFFGGERNPAVDAIIRKLAERPKAVRAAFHQFAQDAAYDQPGQATLMMGEKPSPVGAFNAAFGTDLTDAQYADSLRQAAENPTYTKPRPKPTPETKGEIPKPEHSLEEKLRAAAHQTEGSAKRWVAARETGMTDGELLSMLGKEFGTQGGSTSYGGYNFKGGATPRFWPMSSSRPADAIQGKKLVELARRALGIGHPKTEEAPAQAGQSTPPAGVSSESVAAPQPQPVGTGPETTTAPSSKFYELKKESSPWNKGWRIVDDKGAVATRAATKAEAEERLAWLRSGKPISEFPRKPIEPKKAEEGQAAEKEAPEASKPETPIWQMSRKEVLAKAWGPFSNPKFREKAWEAAVRKAVADGEPVPENVLAEFPDLKTEPENPKSRYEELAKQYADAVAKGDAAEAERIGKDMVRERLRPSEPKAIPERASALPETKDFRVVERKGGGYAVLDKTDGRMMNIANTMEQAAAHLEHNQSVRDKHGNLTGSDISAKIQGKTESEQPSGYGDKNTTFTRDKMEAARERLRKKMGSQLNSGLDPETLGDLIDIGGYHFEAGVREFADWAKKVLADVGEWARPHLQTVFNGVRETLGGDQPQSKTRVAKLIDVFEKSLRDGSLPTDPRELRKMAKDAVGGDPTEYTDDIYDAIEGASNRVQRGLRPKDIGDRIQRAAMIENGLGKRTRSLGAVELQQFSTPHPISEAAAYAADARDGETALEPTAGTGNLVEPLRDRGIKVIANELDERRANVLRANGYEQVDNGDYIRSNYAGRAQVVVTNPPWGKISTGRYKKLDIPSPWGRFNDVSERFFVKAFNDLPDGGRIVAVMPTTILQAGSKGFRDWIEEHGTLEAMIQSPPGAYEHRGTTVDSVLLVADKGKVDGVEPILRVESNQPKDWAEYAEAVRPLAEGGSNARDDAALQSVHGQSVPTSLGPGEPARGRAPGAGRPSGGQGLLTRRGLLEGPGVGRPGESGVGSDVVPAMDHPESVDSAGAVGDNQLAATPRLVRQGATALRPDGADPERQQQFDDAQRSNIFTPYATRSGIGGNPHPRQVVETRSLAGAPAPELTYKPKFNVLDAHRRGVVSDEQVDQAIAMRQAQENGHAFMAADDVGLGKSRELALVAQDLFDSGRKKILVLSKGEVNLRDLEDEFKVVAGVGPRDQLPFRVLYLRDFKESSERGIEKSGREYRPLPEFSDGKTVYLVESTNLAAYRRAIRDLAPDAVLADEVHAYKNEEANLGAAWVDLHKDWMGRNVPIGYFSATPATTVDELKYLLGLREWSTTPGSFENWLARKTGTATREQQEEAERTPMPEDDVAAQVGSDATDVHAPRNGGRRRGAGDNSPFSIRVSTAEMEQIMRELKMKGKYSARDLWRGGVEFGQVDHPLTPEEAEKLSTAVNFMRDVYGEFQKWGRMNKENPRPFGITSALQFAAKRLLADLRLSRALDEADTALQRGEQPVISLIEISETEAAQGNIGSAINAINTQHKEKEDDGEINDLGEIPEAVAAKNELIERAQDEFPGSPSPIDLILKKFGKNNVAVITGEQKPEQRRKMMEEFQKGIKKVAVISGAGKTGISLHHVVETLAGEAKGKRHLILSDYEWSAPSFKQELGRVDRAGQLSSPKISAITLGTAAEKKFIATIANRMKSLGAVSKGAAESTGTAALENFELGGDMDNLAMREAWAAMPYELRDWFLGNKFRESQRDGSSYPRSTIQGADLKDFLLQLQLQPPHVGNEVWNLFEKKREELENAEWNAANQARRTQKLTGEITRVHQLKPDLDLYEVKDASGSRAGILSGMVTDYMSLLRYHLTDEPGAAPRREYISFTGDNGELVSGLRLRPGLISPVAKTLGGDAVMQHTPESALEDLRAGDSIPLENGWSLRMGKAGEKKGYILIDGARLTNTNRGRNVMPHGAKYKDVSGGFFYLPEDGDTVKRFLTEFPIKKALAAQGEDVMPGVASPRPKVGDAGYRPGPGAQNDYEDVRSGRSHLQELIDWTSRMPKDASPRRQVRLAADVAENMGRSKDAISRAVSRVQGASAALWKAYREGAVRYSDFQRAVDDDWSGPEQEAALELQEFVKVLMTNIPDKARREAMTNWLEADGDEDVLRERASMAGSRFRKGYEDALTLTDDERTFVSNVRNFMDAELEEAQKAGILEHGVDNYIQHIWKRASRDPFVKKLVAEINYSALQPNPSFAKKRVWDTFFTGEQKGAEPVSKDIAFLLSVHHQSLMKAIAARNFLKALLNTPASDGRPLAVVEGGMRLPKDAQPDESYLVRPHQRNAATGDYREINHPALRKWKWVGEDADGNPAFLQGNMVIHPEVYRKLRNMLGTSAIRQFEVGGYHPGRAVLRGAAEFKNVLLSFSGFHQTTEGQHALFHRVSPFHDVSEIDLSDVRQKRLLHSGLMAADFNALEEFSEGLAGGGIVTKIPFVGERLHQYNQYLFQSYIPRLKMKMALAALDRNMKRYGGELSEDQIYKLTANQANAAFGELNYRSLGRNKTMQDVLRLALLAPDFLEARARFVGQAIRPYGREQSAALLLGAAVMYGVARVANQLLDDDAHWDKPFSLVYKGHEYAPRTIQGDIWHLASDPRGFAMNRLNPATTRAATEWLTGRDWRGVKRDASDQLLDYLKSAAPIPAQGFITKHGTSWRTQVTKAILGAVGVNEKENLTAAERDARNYTSETRVAPASRPQLGILRKYRKQIGEGELDERSLAADTAAGRITPKDRAELIKESRTPRLGRDFADLNFDQALEVWGEMNQQERQQNRAELVKKFNREVAKYPVAQRQQLRDKMTSALSTPASHLPGFLRKIVYGGNAQQGRSSWAQR